MSPALISHVITHGKTAIDANKIFVGSIRDVFPGSTANSSVEGKENVDKTCVLHGPRYRGTVRALRATPGVGLGILAPRRTLPSVGGNLG